MEGNHSTAAASANLPLPLDHSQSHFSPSQSASPYNLRSVANLKSGASASATRNLRRVESGHDGSDRDTDFEPQEYYTGGEKSGMLVQDPTKAHDVDAIFDQAIWSGSVEAATEHRMALCASSFAGTGRLLSGEVLPTLRPPQPPKAVIHNITFWKYGFTVDDGPLRRLNDPQNSAFLESIRRSECPQELAPENERTAIHVNLMKKEEDYKEPVRYVHVMALCKKDKAKEGGECAQDDADVRTAGGRDVRQRLSEETPLVRGRGRGRAKGDRATRQRTDPVANTDGGGGSMPNAAVGGGVPMEDEPNITDLRTLYKLLGEHIRREVDRMRREGDLAMREEVHRIQDEQYKLLGEHIRREVDRMRREVDLAMREEVHRIQDEFVRLSMRMHRAPAAASPSHQTSGLTDVVHASDPAASDTAASQSPAPLVVEDEEDEDYGI